MKIKVCQRQYDYYESLPKTSTLLTRLMREFTLSYPTATDVLDKINAKGCEEVFEVYPDVDYIPIPSFEGDTRRLFWLSSDQYQWLQDKLEEAVGGAYYENLDNLTISQRDEILRSFEAMFYPHQLNSEDKQKLVQMARQHFLGVRDLDISSSSEAVEIMAWLQFQIETGSTVSEAVSEFFRCMSTEVEPVHLATAYSAVAEVLYDEAERLIEEGFGG